LQQPIFIDQLDRLALHVVLKIHRALNSQSNEIMRSTPLGSCSIPDVCIDERRLPLFIARATLRGLIAVLEARTTGDAAL
jgi:hypothetical protein